MKPLNWLDLSTEPCLDSVQVRLACGNPSSATWARHRRLCGIPIDYRGDLSIRRACSLWACRWLFSYRKIRGRTDQEIKALIIATVGDMLASDNSIDLERFLLWCDGSRSGRQLLLIVGNSRPSRSTLYRRGLRVASQYKPKAARKLLCPTPQRRYRPKTDRGTINK